MDPIYVESGEMVLAGDIGKGYCDFVLMDAEENICASRLREQLAGPAARVGGATAVGPGAVESRPDPPSPAHPRPADRHRCDQRSAHRLLFDS